MRDGNYRRVQRLLARNILHRRKQLNLTQEAAAQAIGMATRHYQKLESGELNITLRTLTRVASAFDVEIADLFTNQESNG